MRGQLRRSRRGGSSNIIAVVLILALTVTAGVILWAYRPPLPPTPVSLQYEAIGDQSEPAWGDPTDCGGNTGINASCITLPSFFLVVTSHTPSALVLTAVTLDFRCNGTSLVNGSLASLEVVPGTGANPSAGSPKLGTCGTWSPNPHGNQATFFNRLLYFQQLSVGAPILSDGDQIVVYEHPAANFCDNSHPANCPDDDYHGAPPWCFTVPDACTIYLTYTEHPVTLIATIPVGQLAA